MSWDGGIIKIKINGVVAVLSNEPTAFVADPFISWEKNIHTT